MRRTIPLDQLQVVGLTRLESLVAETERAVMTARSNLVTAVNQLLDRNDCAGGQPVERILDPPSLVVEMKDPEPPEPQAVVAPAAPQLVGAGDAPKED